MPAKILKIKHLLFGKLCATFFSFPYSIRNRLTQAKDWKAQHFVVGSGNRPRRSFSGRMA
jgi:hypothetical protein